ncbi:anti-sigma factor [Mycolicibacterium madagascariense]|uniref:Anti-sigma factor n=1 Tax=Mycolicibacterium madagascariense TaxID=212765 RepID=A0A7I7XB99_9MYCO|nr:zf-HC2 domain-containing protein [Mycolicibacterium madagascariense]MCV7014486.1 zf-HC2 domain-containing protein [Mycolicibacterium madagascariense]BBZ26864.1 anti-sigma factor [Mycolicibacterium madagascariense]
MTQPGEAHGVERVGGDRYATWDAAYVLGSLSSGERREFEAHLATCAGCRAAVAELSGVPALLGLLDVEDVRGIGGAQPEPPPLRPEVLQTVLDRVRWRRRRSRWLMAAAVGVAAALLAVGLVVVIRPELVGLTNGASTEVSAAQLPMNQLAPTSVRATVALSSFVWGTRVDMVCTYGRWTGHVDEAPSTLAMVVVGRDGSRTQIATWLGLSGATALPSGNTTMPKDHIASVQLVSLDSGRVLLERRW